MCRAVSVQRIWHSKVIRVHLYRVKGAAALPRKANCLVSFQVSLHHHIVVVYAKKESTACSILFQKGVMQSTMLQPIELKAELWETNCKGLNACLV